MKLITWNNIGDWPCHTHQASNLIRCFFYAVIIFFLISSVPCTADEEVIISSSGIRKSERAFKLSEIIVAELGKKMGVRIKLVDYPSIRSTRMLEKGTLHAEFNRIAKYQEKVPSAIRVKEPIAEIPYYVFTHRDDIKVNGWESLKPYKIVTVRGYAFVHTYLKNHQTHPTGSMLSALQFLSAKRADLLIADPITPVSLLNSSTFKGKNIKRLEPPVGVLFLYTFFSYRYPHYAKKYNHALVELKKEGFFQKNLLETQ